jgi:hypothetical protein
MMRRAAVLAAGLALAGAAVAQETPAVDDVPAGDGAIVGRVVHGGTGAGVAGADVVIYAIAPDGRPGVRRGQSGAEGAFRFDGLGTAPGTAYLLGARYQDVPFVGERVAFEPDQTERTTTLTVHERTGDPAAVEVSEVTLRLARIGEELAVAEIYRLRNPSDRVFFLRGDERGADTRPALHALLPEGVLRFALPYAAMPEGLIREDRDVRFYGPVYPGEQELGFTYTLPAPEGDQVLAKRWPTGAERAVLLIPEGLEASAPGFSAGEDRQVDGQRHRSLELAGLAPGSRTRLALRLPATLRDPDAVALSHVRSFLELDDTALQVSEEYHLEVDGGQPVVGSETEPLLRIPIPPEARDVRYGAAAFPSGIATAGGDLVVAGPVPPGASRVDVRYRLPADANPVRFERRYGRPVPTVSLYVADTGLELRSERLHRRRPVKAQERLYMHFEAFHVAADEPVDATLAPLTRTGPLGRGARIAFVLAAASALALFLAAPLRSGARGKERSPADDTDRDEREALYAALRDLEHDFETGKLSQEDFARMRDELRARAASLLRAERSAEAAPAADERKATSCGACGAEPPQSARFCPQCGAPLADGPGAAA